MFISIARGICASISVEIGFIRFQTHSWFFENNGDMDGIVLKTAIHPSILQYQRAFNEHVSKAYLT